ncbi:3-oxoacid CoA-transferase subunit B [Devosia sp. YIM 151766]|uniref:3-oxoacid CoA-transferase subunit B n=1 Tax=Devosia sp. YIM 151766 TaxID=3017325 RepID=UPI00255C4F9C|nr:3-oxoacid CoA-transferase subunit B [Devosia sp. YIM 151766]WIY53169.1 3-oxoacid CoA-transferase subunit B [Devosia sp. YIM 151766]
MGHTIADTIKPRSRNEIARRVARDIGEGWCVNLGIGIPTLVANHVPGSREVIFHSENGILGMGPAPAPAARDTWLVNAGKQYVTLLEGGSYIHHADSFAIARGGRLDLCVLGAYQVACNGDLANWTMGGDAAPAVGGAMDLAVGARRVWTLMSLLTKSGESKLKRACTFPLTARQCVSRIYADYAVIDVTEDGFVATELVPGLSLEMLQDIVEAPIRLARPAEERFQPGSEEKSTSS